MSALLLEKIDKLTEQVAMLCRMQGKMLNRKQMLERYDVCNSTLNKRVAAGQLPTPGSDGRWLVAEVFEFEARR
jgi:predicted DNA-binding transcriptional regulator AlpA